LQRCSTTEFVYDHACFCVYIYFWSIFHICEKTCILCFWSWLTSLSLMSSNYIHLPSNPIIPCGWVIVHCVLKTVEKQGEGGKGIRESIQRDWTD
jgi:hypothetical protein